MLILRKAALLLAGALALAACRKDDPSLSGAVPAPGFTVVLNTSQYPVVATFTNTTTDAFLYQWDFGDGSPLEKGPNPTHTYRLPGTYRVQLTAAGRGGSAITPQQAVLIPSICGNAGFGVLTACAGNGATTWTLSPLPGAIVRLSASGAVLSSSGVLDACQLDDQFSFTNTFVYSYDAGAGTYVGGSCGPALSGNSDFVYKPSGALGQLVLQRAGAFIGPPDVVVNQAYDIVEATPTRLRLQGTNADGTRTVTTFAPQLSALDLAKRFLTGGSTRTWVLDNTVAATIVVGTEAAPSGYYPGGALGSLPPCQADDEFTFTTGGTFTYDAKAETFVAGAFTCQGPRSDTCPYAFGPATGSGLAQFTLAKPGLFIGVTDAPASRVYRILSIDDKNIVLRAGLPNEDPLFTIKLRVK